MILDYEVLMFIHIIVLWLCVVGGFGFISMKRTSKQFMIIDEFIDWFPFEGSGILYF